MIYLDTSAMLKVIFPEQESAAVTRMLDDDAVEMVSSELTLVEARRATMRRAPDRLPRVDQLLNRIDMIEMSSALLESASRLPDPLLRSLDAIHLASALSVRAEVDTLLSCDVRLLAAAAAHGLPTAAPV